MLVASDGAARAAGLALRVLAGRCDGCARCVDACPTGALWLDASRWLAEVDADRCVGCRRCERTCQAGAIVVSDRLAALDDAAACHGGVASPARRDLQVRAGEDGPAGSPWDEAVAHAARCLACPDPPCALACPARLDVLGLVAAVHEDDVAMAAEILERAGAVPGACAVGGDGTPPCERACTWALAGADPVAIGRIERVVAGRRQDLPSAGRGATVPSLAVAGRP